MQCLNHLRNLLKSSLSHLLHVHVGLYGLLGGQVVREVSHEVYAVADVVEGLRVRALHVPPTALPHAAVAADQEAEKTEREFRPCLYPQWPKVTMKENKILDRIGCK